MPWLGGLAAAAFIAAAVNVAGDFDLSGPVTHVRDGDTIEVAGVPVRLQGLHAAELSEPGGHDAKRFMAALVRGRDAACKLTGERNRDRMIGVCFVEHRAGFVDLGEAMVAAGMARDCPRFSGGRYAEAEAEAGRAWSTPLPGYCR